MNKIVIVNRWSGAVIWTGEAESQRAALEIAVAGGADLGGANLRDADLRDANLRDANLRDADLGGADLSVIRDDVWAILSGAPQEVPTLLAKLKAGEVDGSCYEGACACLVGTLANARGVHYQHLCGIIPNSSRPAEMWFTGIHPGDTPETNPTAKLAAEWIEDWLGRMRLAFAPVSA